MTGKDAIKYALRSTHGMVGMYLGDLSDADLLVRPVPGANHIAWQLGHLIVAEQHLLAAYLPGAQWPTLPAGRPRPPAIARCSRPASAWQPARMRPHRRDRARRQAQAYARPFDRPRYRDE